MRPVPEPQAEPPAPQKPRPARPLGTAPGPAKVPLRVYLASCGEKADQIAGFSRWAQKQKLGPCSIQEWREKRSEFNRRPVSAKE